MYFMYYLYSAIDFSGEFTLHLLHVKEWVYEPLQPLPFLSSFYSYYQLNTR